jgi:hypothetical protein
MKKVDKKIDKNIPKFEPMTWIESPPTTEPPEKATPEPSTNA